MQIQLNSTSPSSKEAGNCSFEISLESKWNWIGKKKIGPNIFIKSLGVKIRKLKVGFKTGGTWRQVKQRTLIMNIYDFFIRLSRLVSKRRRINKNHKDGRFLFIRQHFETKRISRIKKS